MLSHEQDQLIPKYQTRTPGQYRPLPTVKTVLSRNVDKSFTTSASLMVVCLFIVNGLLTESSGTSLWRSFTMTNNESCSKVFWFSRLNDTEADHFQN